MTSQMLDEESDGRLMRRFAEERDERAFALLVERRGALVLGVCARMLRNRADADDAFQAVFLVAARRASGLRRYSSLAGWLHNVAVRVSLNVLRANRRRHRQVQEAAEVKPEMESSERLEELRQCIDEELAALPARLREVVVLCDLEDRTRGEVARLLSIPASTVTDRLHRGRELMRKRLMRKGLTVAAGGAAIGLVWCGSTAPAVSADLVRETVRNADAFTWGTEALRAELSLRIVTLAEGALQAMLLAQWKVVVCLFVILAASMFGGAVAPDLVSEMAQTASAETIVYDDFNDGDVTDGSPASWRKFVLDNGEFDASSGDLVLRPYDLNGLLGVINPPIDLRDVSVRAQIRLAGTPEGPATEGIGLLARGSETAGTAYQGGIDLTGGAWIGHNTPDGFFFLGQAQTPLRPGTEDVVLQFDLADDKLSLFAWRAGESKPATPQVEVISHLHDTGTVGFIYDVPDAGDGIATLRYIQVDAVPEPGTRAMCAIGSGLLVAVMLCGQRSRR